MADIYGPPTTLSFYDRGLIASAASALHLMRTYALHPPDDASGSNKTRGANVGTLHGAGGVDIRHGDMGNRKVARLHFTRGDRGQITANEGGDALFGTASYLDAAPGTPVYWLPWDISGAIIKLAIPQMGARLGGRADPDRFFTAAINGCSIFFTGPRNAPTVWHAGGDTGQTGPAAQALFWRNLMAGLGHVGVREVNKEDYIKNSAVPDRTGTNFSTQAAEDYRTWIENTYSNVLEVEDIRPWACVMGIRDNAGDWTFYLQENATVTYTVLRKKKRIFKADKYVPQKEVSQQQTNVVGVIIDKKRSVARTMRVSEIFPNHNIAARVDQPIPRVQHG